MPAWSFCAWGALVDVLGLVVVEADGDCVVVVVSGVFWVVVEVVGAWVCDVLGVVVLEFGDCANAAVANSRPTAVPIIKRVFMLEFLRLRLARTSKPARVPMEREHVAMAYDGMDSCSRLPAAVPTSHSHKSGTFGN